MRQLQNYLIIIFLVCWSIRSQAQLSGIYTIGGSNPDYATINSAVTAITSAGVSGPVIFKIRNGVYNEQILLYNISGSSNNNRVTFCSESGDSSAVIIEYAPNGSPNNVIRLSGASFITFKQLTVRTLTTGLIDDKVFEIGSGSCNNQVLNCRLIQNNHGYIIYSNGNANVDSANVIDQNIILNGHTGVTFSGQNTNRESGNIISHNFLINQSKYAVVLVYQNTPRILSNYVYMNVENVQNNVNGIRLNHSYNGANVDGNTVIIHSDSCTQNVEAIHFEYCYGFYNNSQRIKIYNNIANVISSKYRSGIRAMSMQLVQYADVFYNTLQVTGDAHSALSFNAIQNSRILNNIFVNSTNIIDSISCSIDPIITTNIGSLNYNNYFSNSLVLLDIGTPFSNKYTSLAQWQQNQYNYDSVSVSFDPLFIDSTLEIQNNSPLCGKGIWLPEVTTDINGEIRNNPPTIGAYELKHPCTPISIEHQKEKEDLLQVFPNPNNGDFTLQFTETDCHYGLIVITNIIGKVVFETKLYENNMKINLGLNKGIYFLTTLSKNKIMSKKIIIE